MKKSDLKLATRSSDTENLKVTEGLTANTRRLSNNLPRSKSKTSNEKQSSGSKQNSAQKLMEEKMEEKEEVPGNGK